ncbi:hypothetical protein [Acidovorax sp. Root70]|jgi:hypothetical protein|uniref:hypothetical protein n=1 Tax=Acidovorax sp. Root70 TaxID=1736590 RepID=UPI0006F785EA|nr:hypothetical protein [Acidovorax sp. Root70]KRB40273.1 hypothetical protein ASD94_17230 [Acidovorax sp. Root70]
MQITQNQRTRLVEAIESRRAAVVAERAEISNVQRKWTNADAAKAYGLDEERDELDVLSAALQQPSGQLNW